LEGDEVRGEWWQLITAIHPEGDGLILYEGHSQGSDHICSFMLVLVWLELTQWLPWKYYCGFFYAFL
jgi:hypothetical protein